jgi:hypothetical protein
MWASKISQLDDNYGFADTRIPGHMVEEFKEIYRVISWPEFFRRIRYTWGVQFGKKKISEMLRGAVRTSGQRRYHTPKLARVAYSLKGQRVLVTKMGESSLVNAPALKHVSVL